METAFSLLNLTRPAWPTAATVVLFVVVLFAARAAIDRRVQRGTTKRFGRQIVMVALWGVGLLAIHERLDLLEKRAERLAEIVKRREEEEAEN